MKISKACKINLALLGLVVALILICGYIAVVDNLPAYTDKGPYIGLEKDMGKEAGLVLSYEFKHKPCAARG